MSRETHPDRPELYNFREYIYYITFLMLYLKYWMSRSLRTYFYNRLMVYLG